MPTRSRKGLPSEEEWSIATDFASRQRKEAWTLFLVVGLGYLVLHCMLISFESTSADRWISWIGIPLILFAVIQFVWFCVAPASYWKRQLQLANDRMDA